MTKTTLSTNWICIATSGPTVDGREISPQDLLDMAANYNTNEYTALIWPEHYRWQNYGKVLEVKAEQVNDNEVKLFAKISPNANLLTLNQEGQKLFTSIEIYPNFNNSGKPYLGGLAVTDSPASRGTTELNFAVRGIPAGTTFGNVESFSFQLLEDEEQQAVGLFKFFAKLFSEKDKASEKVEPTFSANLGNPHTNEAFFQMTKEELQAAIQAGIAAAFAAQKQPEQAKETEKAESKEETVSAEQFNALKAQFDELSEKFNQATQTVATAVPNGAATQFNAKDAPIF
ncbi:GPO family capsid scaffolding protein [Mannheimia sp. E30BD]|uniref:GPO family capsid scaffolding protein n=1 Tax=Mannheimia sp. E30BD TaxID=3278708 RepID=UPI00359D1E30